MPKHIHVVVDDDKHAAMKEAKGDRDWRDVLLDGLDMRECGVDP